MASPSLTKIAYLALQKGKSLAGIAHKELSAKLMELVSPDSLPSNIPINTELIKEVSRSISELEELDWEDAENGIYPKSQLFEAPWINWVKKYPLIWLDMPATWERRKRRKINELPKKIKKDYYPNYYLQNFHHQTDGYLSDHSAGLYDIQVEILFNGTADAMRRRIISPLKTGLKIFSDRNYKDLKVLDVATGTGRTLQQIRVSLPEVDLSGLDLSGYYLKQASKSLSDRKGEMVQLIKGNAEDMPFKENSFQAVTCVFLLHELPREARQNVLKECFRILEPGGILVLADSVQISDSPSFKPILDNFHKIFHEPYYFDYLNDDIDKRLNLIGYENIKAQSYFMTRVWAASKPNI